MIVPAFQPSRRSLRSRREARRRLLRQTVWWGSISNIVIVAAVWVLPMLVSDQAWLGASLLYLPRLPLLLTSLLLVPLACLAYRRLVAINMIALLLAAGPIMGLKVRVWSPASSSSSPRGVMRLASRNVGGVEPVFESLVPELLSVTPDIVILQDAAGGHPLLATAFKDWHRSQAGEYYVASRFPLRHVANFRSAQFDRNAAAAFEIVHPDGKFLLVSVRLTAPQGELDILAPGKLISSAARAEVTAHVRQRAAEAADVRAFIEEHRREMPLVIAGDFGMPASCSAFRECAAGLRNAFDAGGRGYGYTAPCRAARFWPGDTPWMRVDHCLTSADWQIERCWTGDGDGADHRMIGAVLHW